MAQSPYHPCFTNPACAGQAERSRIPQSSPVSCMQQIHGPFLEQFSKQWYFRSWSPVDPPYPPSPGWPPKWRASWRRCHRSTTRWPPFKLTPWLVCAHAFRHSNISQGIPNKWKSKQSVNLLFLFNCSKSSPRKRRCDLKKLKAKTVEITKKDVALNNLIQRAKPIMHV